VGDGLYLRDDTPLHSALHEACHYGEKGSDPNGTYLILLRQI
jgi:hypothetical protein